ncbi:MAG TPA: tryptophan 2,3-dioxygenase family protein [Symbiobacteriaceae bacterium]|jgi:tryptophan 2,3-dioxygenase
MAETPYERYINTDQLLACQKSPGELVNHDELCFQLVHQVAELWMKLCCHELTEVIRIMDGDEEHLWRAVHLLRRVQGIVQQLSGGIEALDTMHPADYMPIRAHLGSGSGMESPGFNRLLAVGAQAAESCRALLARHGIPPLELQRNPEANYLLYQVMQGLLDFDAAFQRFRLNHVVMAMRQIGNTVGTGGVAIPMLFRRAQQSLVPELWEAIGHLSEEHRHGYGAGPEGK